MAKVYVLDTNVLLHDPKAIFQFGGHDVALPIYVVELDQFVSANGLGRNAQFARERTVYAVLAVSAKGSNSRAVEPLELFF